ncbi:MAG TPA: tetratricopeptide repeat protein [Drouetiella sp.]
MNTKESNKSNGAIEDNGRKATTTRRVTVRHRTAKSPVTRDKQSISNELNYSSVSETAKQSSSTDMNYSDVAESIKQSEQTEMNNKIEHQHNQNGTASNQNNTANNQNDTASNSNQIAATKPTILPFSLDQLLESNKKWIASGIIASVAVSVIAGTAFGISKVMSSNTDPITYIKGFVNDRNGDQYMRDGKVVQAIDAYKKAIEVSPNDMEAYKKLGYLYEFDARDFDQAAKILKNATYQNDGDADIWRLLAYAQFWGGYNKDAMQSIQKSLDLRSDDPLATSVLALINAAGSDNSRARELMQQAMAKDPNNTDILRNASVLYRFYIKDNDKAEEIIRRAIKLAPSNSSMYYELGAVLNAENKNDDAVDALRKAKSLQPSDPYRSIDLAEALHNDGKNSEAEDSYIEAFSDGLHEANALFRYAGTLYDIGKYSDAEKQLKEAVSIAPSNSDYVLLLGKSQYYAGEYSAAIGTFTTLTVIQNTAKNWNWVGVAQYAAKDYDGAIASFTKSISLDNSDATIWANRASAYDQKGDTTDASSDVLQSLKLDPNYESAWTEVVNIGNHMVNAWRPGDARALYQSALNYASNSLTRNTVAWNLQSLS